MAPRTAIKESAIPYLNYPKPAAVRYLQELRVDYEYRLLTGLSYREASKHYDDVAAA